MTREDDGMDIDERLVEAVAEIATAAGDRLLAVWTPDSRPDDRDGLIELAMRNERVASDGLQDALAALRPGARFVDDELETSPLPDGEWWVVDDAEGSVNHVHGLGDWGVSIALVVDGEPVLAVFRQPVGDRTYTAFRGHGATLNGRPLAVSKKQGLGIAIVGTGQAEAGQQETYGLIGRSITAMLEQAFLVRATVPSTFPMLLVAGGNMEAFWQFGVVLPGVAVGSLLIEEAGGIVTTVEGDPWRPGATSILVAAPGVHADVRTVLEAVRR